MDISLDYGDFIDAAWIKGEVILDCRDGFIGLFVGPDSVFGFAASGGDAVVGAIAFIGAVAVMGGAHQLRHIRVFARDVVDGRIAFLFENQGV